jgi:hypothetical protein
MDSITIRYGESLTLPIDSGDTTAVSAYIYIGRPGEVYTLTSHISLIDGMGTFVFLPIETQIPLGVYYYQINILDSAGILAKYPSPEGSCDGCESDFPQFIVCEALDEIEVS